MVSVVDFIRWGLTHCKKATLPAEVILSIDAASVGSCGEWEYQADNGLTVDGKAGRNTITALGGRWAG